MPKVYFAEYEITRKYRVKALVEADEPGHASDKVKSDNVVKLEVEEIFGSTLTKLNLQEVQTEFYDGSHDISMTFVGSRI
jgi:hypothetical protein